MDDDHRVPGPVRHRGVRGRRDLGRGLACRAPGFDRGRGPREPARDPEPARAETPSTSGAASRRWRSASIGRRRPPRRAGREDCAHRGARATPRLWHGYRGRVGSRPPRHRDPCGVLRRPERHRAVGTCRPRLSHAPLEPYRSPGEAPEQLELEPAVYPKQWPSVATARPLSSSNESRFQSSRRSAPSARGSATMPMSLLLALT